MISKWIASLSFAMTIIRHCEAFKKAVAVHWWLRKICFYSLKEHFPVNLQNGLHPIIPTNKGNIPI